MKKYLFSIPMPYKKEFTDRVIHLNKELYKSEINTFYFALPLSCNLFSGFELNRFNNEISVFNYWKDLIKYSIDSGFDFIYLLNSSLPVDFNRIDIQIEKLNILLNELKDIGVNKLRVSNPQLILYLNNEWKNFEILSSVSCEYKTIREYNNFLEYFPFIKQIVPAPDCNRNFLLLKNLSKLTELELMVNEGCIVGCSLRKYHYMVNNNSACSNNKYFSAEFYGNICNLINTCDNSAIYLCFSNCVYPWQIEEYSKIGINNFKFTGRDMKDFITGRYFDYYELYLKGIDDYTLIENIPISYFNNYISDKNKIPFKVKDLKPYLPKIQHFKKYGHLCASRCGVECRYCYKCAKKIQKVFEKKQAEFRKRTIPICFIK